MGIDWQISFASKTLYFIAIVATIHLLTSGLMLATWMLGSGIVDVGSAYVLAGQTFSGYTIEIVAIAMFAAAAYFVGQRDLWAFQGALTVLVSDALALFDRVAALGAPASGIGLLASILVVFHGIVFWCVLRAYWAAKQDRINRSLVKRMEFEAELKRRLSESDAPPPPAATFDTRYRPAPPTGAS